MRPSFFSESSDKVLVYRLFCCSYNKTSVFRCSLQTRTSSKDTEASHTWMPLLHHIFLSPRHHKTYINCCSVTWSI